MNDAFVTPKKMTRNRLTSTSISLQNQKAEFIKALEPSNETLPNMFPTLSSSLNKLRFFTPTPIQKASANPALNSENLILIAPTGSGKTLGYLLPALTKAIKDDGTILIVAPTRELAAQLMRDSVSIASNLVIDSESSEPQSLPSILLSVRGVDIPTSEQVRNARILIGTPYELLYVLTNIQGGQNFLAGDMLSTIILDEVDVLLPNPPKEFRTALDNNQKYRNRRGRGNSSQDERRKLEQKRKLNAARRRGMDISSSNNGKSGSAVGNAFVLTDTDKLLRVIASRRFSGGDASTPYQILAGSATASRRTLDRLNKSLREAASEVSSSVDVVWSGNVRLCRPIDSDDGIDADTVIKSRSNHLSTETLKGSNIENDDTITKNIEMETESPTTHTIRSVTVPTQVTHRFITLDKESATSPTIVLSNLARVAKILNPKTALIFICGEFGKANKKEKNLLPKNKKGSGATSASRRKSKKIAAAKSKEKIPNKSMTEPLSARKACSTLAKYGIDAKPLHVVLGLEQNSKESLDEDEEEDESLPYLVTFEGSARGLHFDAVDVVFIVGRPSSAASYLHLAGRVGRSSTAKDGSGEIVVNPGSVVSFCTKGSANELSKWTQQVGAKELEEFVFE